MPHDPILHLLGLAKKAGRLEIGEEPVGAAARAHQARVLLLAADAAPNTVRRAAQGLCFPCLIFFSCWRFSLWRIRARSALALSC